MNHGEILEKWWSIQLTLKLFQRRCRQHCFYRRVHKLPKSHKVTVPNTSVAFCHFSLWKSALWDLKCLPISRCHHFLNASMIAHASFSMAECFC